MRTGMWQRIFPIMLLMLSSSEMHDALQEQGLTENMQEIMQFAADAVRELVPPRQYPGWEDETEMKTNLIINSIKLKYGLERRIRRNTNQHSFARDDKGVHIIQGKDKSFNTGAKHPTDINIFALKNKRNEEQWYAIALESKNASSLADELVLYVFDPTNSRFIPVLARSIQGGVDVEVIEIENNLLLAVAEFEAGNKPLEGSSIFQVLHTDNDKINLRLVQKLNTTCPRDITTWEYINRVYLAVAQGSGKADLNVSLIYRWEGHHFDLIGTIPTSDARRIHSFNIGNYMYLAVANHMQKPGHKQAYSEIFKYNVHDGKFMTHQKIITSGATDVSVFCFETYRKSETYMIIANAYDTDEYGNKDYSTESVIYKAINDLFHPFQSLTVPAVTHWEPIANKNEEFVLLGVSTVHGVRAVQYNGWRFVEMDVKIFDDSIARDVSNIRSVQFLNSKFAVIASRSNDGSKEDLIALKYYKDNMLRNMHHELGTWCTTTLKAAKQLDVHRIRKLLEDAPKTDSPILEIFGDARFNVLSVGESTTEHIASPNRTLDIDTRNQIIDLRSKVQKVTDEVTAINEETKKTVNLNQNVTVPGNLILKNVTLPNPERSYFGKTLNINYINEDKFDDFMDRVVDVRRGINYGDELNALQFANISANVINARSVNGMTIEDFVTASSGELTRTTAGRLALETIPTVHGNVGLSKIGTLQDHNIKSQKLESSENRTMHGRAAEINHKYTDSLVVENLIVDGLINGVSLTDLSNNYMKTKGDQEVKGSLSFESLIIEDHCIISGKMSDVSIPSDIVTINEGTMHVAGLYFPFTLEASNISVKHKLNDMQIDENGHMPLLLVNTSKEQHVTGRKSIGNLHVIQSGIIHGNMQDYSNKETEVISTDVFIDGNISLPVKVTMASHGTIYTKDIASDHASIQRLLSHGIPLDAAKISIPITLDYVDVKSLEVEKINDVNTSSWILDSDENVHITGKKVFNDNIYLEQPIQVHNLLNGVNLLGFESDLLKTEGDQVITGRKTFTEVHADSISAQDVEIGNVHWSNILKSNGEQTILGDKTFTDEITVTKELQVNDLHVEKAFATIDLILNDSMFHNENEGTVQIPGPKYFEKPFTTASINIDIDGHYEDADEAKHLDDTVVYTGDLIIKHPMKINKLVYKGYLDSIRDEDFGKIWLTSDGKHELSGTQHISSLTVSDSVHINSGHINSVNFDNLAQNTLYTDHDINLNSVQFDTLTIHKSLQLDGKLQEMDLVKDAVFTDEDAIITGSKTFLQKVTVDNLSQDHQLAQFDLKHLCQLVFSGEKESLRIKGSVQSYNEPLITETLNEYEMKGLNKELWFKNKDTTVPKRISFKSMKFESDVFVEGTVDGVNLESLHQNYFSKSKHQSIRNTMSFDQAVTFKQNLFAHKARVAGYVGDFYIQDFDKRVMHDGLDQDVFALVEFDTVRVDGDVAVTGQVNSLDLAKDVMLLNNGVQKVTGHTKIQGVNCKDIHLSSGATLQRVDVPQWMKIAVRAAGDFAVKGVKSLYDAEFTHAQVYGLVGGKPFTVDTVLVDGLDQKVTGAKVFVSELVSNPALDVNNLTVHGRVNDLDFNQFYSRLAFKEGDVQFNEYANISGSISAKNMQINGLFHGVNISALHPRLLAAENMKEAEATFHQLMENARIVEKSLAAQAVYLSHYKLVQNFPAPVEAILPLYTDTSQESIILLTPVSATDVAVNILTWNNKTKAFSPLGSPYEVPTPLYINTHVERDSVTTCSLPVCYTTNISKLLHGTQPQDKILAFDLHGNDCYLVISTRTNNLNGSAKIICETSNNAPVIYQELPVINPIQGSVFFFHHLPHLVTVQGAVPGVQKSSVTVWSLDDNSFTAHQAMHYVEVVDVSTVHYRGRYFLAVASGLLEHAAHEGVIYILRLDINSGTFLYWHELRLTAPTSIQFAILPSNELVLYAITSNGASPFVVYAYKGEEGFKEATRGATIGVAHTINAFTFKHRHFVALTGESGAQLLEACFKGHF